MLSQLKHHAKKIAPSAPSILAIYLHGSVASGSSTPLSDTDLGVFMMEAFTDKKRQLEFELDLEEQFSKALPGKKFDIRVLNNAPILVKGKIITEGKCLYSADDEKLSDLIESIILPYLDFKIDYDILIEEIHNNQVHDR